MWKEWGKDRSQKNYKVVKVIHKTRGQRKFLKQYKNLCQEKFLMSEKCHTKLGVKVKYLSRKIGIRN